MKRTFFSILFLIILVNCVPSVPTKQIQYTREPSFSATATSTVVSTPTLIPEIATSNAVEKSCELGSPTTFDYDRDISWDNQWFAINCLGTPFVLKVARFDDSLVWNIPAQDITIGDHTFQTYYNVYRWSKDNKYLYFTPSYYRGDGGYFLSRLGLFILELNSGEIETILEPFGSFEYSMSPNDQLLAYFTFDRDGEINILDLFSKTNTLIRLPRQYQDVGYFVWTLDSRSFVFAAGVDGWGQNNLGLSLYLYDTEKRLLTALIDNDKRMFIPVEDKYDPNYSRLGGRLWLSDDQLPLLSLADDSQWEINIRTRELLTRTNSTPTPTP